MQIQPIDPRDWVYVDDLLYRTYGYDLSIANWQLSLADSDWRV